MADPVRLDVPLHPCNICGDAAHLWYVAWQELPYRTSCRTCQAEKRFATAEEGILSWNQAHPEMTVAHLPHSAAEQTRRQAEIAHECEALRPLLTNDVLQVIDRLVTLYCQTDGRYDYEDSAEGFRDWCVDLAGHPPLADPLPLDAAHPWEMRTDTLRTPTKEVSHGGDCPA